MKFKILIDRIARVVRAITRLLTWIASVAVAVMGLALVANIIGRFIFRQPLLGTAELVGMLTVIVVFFVLSYTELKKGHVHVELLVSRLPQGAQKTLATIMYFLGAVFFSLLSWYSVDLGLSRLFPAMRYTDILGIPFAPFMFAMAFGSLVYAVQMLINFFYSILSEELV